MTLALTTLRLHLLLRLRAPQLLGILAVSLELLDNLLQLYIDLLVELFQRDRRRIRLRQELLQMPRVVEVDLLNCRLTCCWDA